MKKILIITFVLTLGCLVYFSPVSMAAERTLLCHNPPGDSENWHTISVLDDAVRFHLDHGDLLGDCPSDPCAASCDDGNPCTNDLCDPDGGCIHTPVDCNDSRDCTIDYCDMAEGGCSNVVTCGDGKECGYWTGECVGCPPEVKHVINVGISGVIAQQSAIQLGHSSEFNVWECSWDHLGPSIFILGSFPYIRELDGEQVGRAYNRLEMNTGWVWGRHRIHFFDQDLDIVAENTDIEAFAPIDEMIVCGNLAAREISYITGQPCVVEPADILVEKACPDDMIAGEHASYTVKVSNEGPATALNIELTDTLPDYVEFVSATSDSNPLPPDQANGNVLTWILGDIAASASVDINILVEVDEDCPNTTLINNVSVTTTSEEGGQGPDNNSASCSSVVQLPSAP